MNRGWGAPGPKLGLLGTLYLAQGLPFGFFTQALPAILREQGLSLTTISLTNLLLLPWGLKALWAPYVDQHYSSRWGKRRSWVLPLTLLNAVLIWALAYSPLPDGLSTLLGVILMVNLSTATADVASDGLAITVLDPEQRGLGNGIQVGGYRVGMILGGGVLLMLFPRLGWQSVF